MVLAFGIYDRIWFGKIKHSFAEYEVRHKLLPAAITAVNNEVINLGMLKHSFAFGKLKN